MTALDQAFHAIAEPRRREIMTLLQRADELSASEIAERFEITRPAISQHLRVLAEAGLVYVRRDGTRRMYRTRPEGLAELRTFLEGFWDAGLWRLKVAAEAEERGFRT